VLETARDIAIIVVAVLDIILLAILCVIAFLAWRLFANVKGQVPELIDRGKDTLTTVKGTTDFMSDRAVTPVIRITALVAALLRFFSVLFGGERSRVA
jgi:hypothetical protein